MTTAPTTSTTAAPVHLDLDARLAMVGAIMAERLDQAAVAFEVNTAHIPSADPIPEVAAPLPLTPTVAPCPYSTPVAGTLRRARVRLETGGWCTGQLRDEQGARCLIGAIRAAAGSRAEVDDACVLLLEAIRRDFTDAETIPSWNDSQTSPQPALLYLDRAAALAHARGL
jgi:hypothetical protein